MARLKCLLVMVLILPIVTVGAYENHSNALTGTITGELRTWYPLTISFAGPQADETGKATNPFLNYRLQVTFNGPSGQLYTVPGFFDGDGNGNGAGNIWRVHFTPDQAGRWSYTASFRSGPNVAVDLSTSAGSPANFDGATGAFTIVERDPAAPGYLKWGRLEYVGAHYFKLRDGPYWIKGGTDSPETFLGYAGFDNTHPGVFGLRTFTNHVQDWKPGDPDWGAGNGKGIIGALNYLAAQHANSIFFLPMNIGGDGQDTWPYVGPIDRGGSAANDNLHFDLSKLAQWDLVFAHAQRRGIMLHVVLNESEEPNKRELDDATLGIERKLFYRELIARFGYHNAIQWNISEEYETGLSLQPATVKAFAGYLQAVDPYDHPITVHQSGDPDYTWTPFLGDARFSVTSFQYYFSVAGRGAETEEWRTKSKQAGRPIPIALDELRPSKPTNFDAQRKEIIWPNYLSGGNLEFILGGNAEDKAVEDFRPYGPLWEQAWYARKFLEEELPFWEMEPQDGSLSGEATTWGQGHVFAKPGEVYAIYLPAANPSGTLNLSGEAGTFEQRWYNPRTGAFEGGARSIAGGGSVNLGSPPSVTSEDWVVLIKRIDASASPTPSVTNTPTNTAPTTSTSTSTPAPAQPTATATPTTTPTPNPVTTPAVTHFTLINADTDQPIAAFDPLVNGATLNLASLPTRNLNIRAHTNPMTVGSVRFALDANPDYRTENGAPYALEGDTQEDYTAWTPSVGRHTLAATAFSGASASGTAGTALTVSFTVIDQNATATATSTNTPLPTATPTPTPEPTSGTPELAGLTGSYYDNANLTDLKLTRVDPSVNFTWASGSPDPLIGPDSFSARWTGQVKADHSQTYTFYTTSDDGVRMWVNGQLLIDDWTNHSAAQNSGTISLQAGQWYPIKLEYYEGSGSSVNTLSYASPSTPKQIIPANHLMPATP